MKKLIISIFIILICSIQCFSQSSKQFQYGQLLLTAGTFTKIEEVYIRKTDENDWGKNILQTSISAATTITLEQGLYEIKIESSTLNFKDNNRDYEKNDTLINNNIFIRVDCITTIIVVSSTLSVLPLKKIEGL
jgi:hypothetical protein